MDASRSNHVGSSIEKAKRREAVAGKRHSRADSSGFLMHDSELQGRSSEGAGASGGQHFPGGVGKDAVQCKTRKVVKASHSIGHGQSASEQGTKGHHDRGY